MYNELKLLLTKKPSAAESIAKKNLQF